MKERPILFSGPMVRALLAGTKTQTRRVVKPQPPAEAVRVVSRAGALHVYTGHGGYSHSVDHCLRCPYGQPGDRLWVRETWTLGRANLKPKSGATLRQRGGATHPVLYRANDLFNDADHRWRPSIFMPRWASRLTLEVTDVRVERLQDISEEDADAEGVTSCDGMLDEVAICRHAAAMKQCAEDSRPWFATHWESINGAGSWGANPWVWALTFRVTP